MPGQSTVEAARPTQRRLLFPLTFVLLFLVVGYSAVLMKTHGNRLENDARELIGSVEQRFSISINNQTRLLSDLAYLLSSEPRLREGLLARDRHKLLEDYEHVFSEFKNDMVTHFYLHDSQRVNVLRFYNPGKYGDEIKRSTLLKAQKSGKPTSGLELGKYGTFTLRVVQPVLDGDGAVIGYLELGKEIEDVLSAIKEQHGVELLLVIHKELLNRERWEEGMRILGRSPEWGLLPRCAISYNSSSGVPEELLPIVEEVYGGNGDINREITFAERSWRVMKSIVSDIDGVDTGVLFILWDITDSATEMNRVVKATLTVAIFLITVLIGFLYHVLRQTDRGIIGQQATLELSNSALTKRVKFEHLISDISTKLVGVDLEKMDEEIEGALRAVGEFSAVDRCYLFLFAEDQKTISNTHEWCAETVTSQLNQLQGMDISEDLPWFAKHVLEGRVYSLADIDLLPENAETDRRFFERLGIKSLITMPVFVGARVLGFLGYDSETEKRDWTRDDMALLRILGENLALIVERKRSQDRLTSSRDFLQAVINGIPDPLMVIDKDYGIVMTNEKVSAMWGDRDLGKEGCTCYQISHHRETPCDGVADPCPLREVIKRGEPVMVEHVHYDEKGNASTVEIVASPVKDKNGEVVQIIELCRDITERRRTEEALRRTQKLAGLNEMAAGIAHDFNNILSVVIGFSELTEDELPEGSQERQNIREVISAAERGTMLAKKMLDFSGQSGTDIIELDLTQHLKIYGEQFNRLIPERMSLEYNLTASPWTVMADSDQISQVLRNLLKNSIEAMEENPGVVTIKTRNVVLEEELQDFFKRLLSPGRYVELEVLDEGIGIEEEVMPRIFDPFFSTKFTGRGLGLSSVFGIVQECNGGLMVDSHPGEGTRIRILFPAAASGKI